MLRPGGELSGQSWRPFTLKDDPTFSAIRLDTFLAKPYGRANRRDGVRTIVSTQLSRPDSGALAHFGEDSLSFKQLNTVFEQTLTGIQLTCDI